MSKLTMNAQIGDSFSTLKVDAALAARETGFLVEVRSEGRQIGIYTPSHTGEPIHQDGLRAYLRANSAEHIDRINNPELQIERRLRRERALEYLSLLDGE
jgi:hypothetical protein